MPQVVSSTIRSIDYEANTQTLIVVFINGGRYRYFNVSHDVYERFLRAVSKGQFLDTYIKDKYRFSRG